MWPFQVTWFASVDVLNFGWCWVALVFLVASTLSFAQDLTIRMFCKFIIIYLRSLLRYLYNQNKYINHLKKIFGSRWEHLGKRPFFHHFTQAPKPIGGDAHRKFPSSTDASKRQVLCRDVDPWFGDHMGVSKNNGTPKWMVKIMENPMKMDDLGVPLFLEAPTWISCFFFQT